MYNHLNEDRFSIDNEEKKKSTNFADKISDHLKTPGFFNLINLALNKKRQ